jgi:cobalt-zinc-cadmium efflux system membrane fusion protein
MDRTGWTGSALAIAWLVVQGGTLAGCAWPEAPGTPAAAPAGPERPSGIAPARCAAHGAPRELCFICDPALREPGRLWCAEHARYEDRCWECHPKLRDATRLWCTEHSLYEDECFLCHPELLEREAGPGSGAAEGAPAAAALMCGEHGVAEDTCGICHPELLAERAPGQGLQVRLPSAASAAKAGVVVGRPGSEHMPHGVECLAELSFDRNRLAIVAPPVAGAVHSVEVDLGHRVRQGDLLARLTSGELTEAEGAYLRALAESRLSERTLARERELRVQRVSSEKEVQEAEAAHHAALASLRQARGRLQLLGLDERQTGALEGRAGTPGLLELRAPFDGEIVERSAVRGMIVEAGQALFGVADGRRMWAMIDIPESLLPRVRVGQPVELTVESLPGETFGGTLTWLATEVDGRTRMARARAEVVNPGGRLKARMFARAFVVTADAGRSVVVPRAAVQSVGGRDVVFVASAADLFEARAVELGAARDGLVEVVAGLEPTEPVVLAGSFSLKSHLLLSRLGAGCAD